MTMMKAEKEFRRRIKAQQKRVRKQRRKALRDAVTPVTPTVMLPEVKQ